MNTPLYAPPQIKPETRSLSAQTKSFGPDADTFLAKFYADYSITATAGKIKLLEDHLGGPSNFYGLGGEVNDEMKLACLEYEFLERQGKITLTLA
jgi:hypothetical protein